MDLLPDEDQAHLVSTFRGLLEDKLPVSRLREFAAARADFMVEGWPLLADMGLFSLMLGEDKGGAGLGVADQALVFREIGRHLTPGPLIGTVLGGYLTAADGHDDVSAQLAFGTWSAALAEPFRDPNARIEPAPTGSFRVLGAATGVTHVLFCAGAGWALVSAPALVDVLDRKTGIDPAVPLHLVSDCPAEPVVSGRSPHMTTLGRVLTAAWLCGLAEATRDQSANHASSRRQFGKPIGAFQAVKHRCADMAVRVEAAWAQTAYAALAFDHNLADMGFQAAAAKLLAADAAVTNGADNIQNHGGMGFTADLDAHLYLRRACLLEHVFGAAPTLCDYLVSTPASGSMRLQEDPPYGY